MRQYLEKWRLTIIPYLGNDLHFFSNQISLFAWCVTTLINERFSNDLIHQHSIRAT